MTVLRGANPFDSLPPGTKGLIVANVAVFVAQQLFPYQIAMVFGLTAANVLQRFWIWQLITYSFLHGNFTHIFFNMFALWLFGPHIEAYWGTRSYLRYYFICVLGAALCQLLIVPSGLVVGASGGLYGLFLAFGFLFPDAVIYIFFIFPMRAIQAVVVIALMTFIFSLQSGGGHVAHLAHFGGLASGFLYFKLPLWSASLRRGIRWPFGKKSPQWDIIHPEKPVDELTAQVDRILDKISAKGVNSLTAEEHEIMRQYSRRNEES